MARLIHGEAKLRSSNPARTQCSAAAAYFRACARLRPTDNKSSRLLSDFLRSTTLADAAERARHYAGRSKSPATIDAYAADWRDFLSYCQRRGASALPATDATVAGYWPSWPTRSSRRPPSPAAW